MGETLGEVLRRIGRRAGLEGVLALTDAQLLERFTAGRDEPAFAALMVRHGPMVLGVCRRLLHDADQAEDAFQAAFLVLARKAGAIRRRPLLAAWLYGVACKVASRLRGRTWRRQAREKPADFDAVPAGAEPDASDYPAIHEEVRRLPDKYRNPVVLCYLEGKTHEEAARLMRCPLGTVKGRLSRARDLLRSRLERRGVGPGEDAWRTALAGVPPSAALVDATVRAAPLFAAGDATVRGLIRARALALSQGVLRAMMFTNGKILAALTLAAAMLVGTGSLLYRTSAAEPGPAPKAAADADKPPAVNRSKDDKDAIQGTWEVTGVEMGGKDVSGTDEFKDLASAKWVFTADKVAFQMKNKGDQSATYKLDPTKKPKELDVTPLQGPPNEKDKRMPAIYSLEDDVLKICAASPDAPTRPTELASKEGTKNLLITFKREKPDQDKPKDDEAIQGAWVVVGREFEGDTKTKDELKKDQMKMVVKGDKATFTSRGDDIGQEDTIKLVPTASPKAIDKTSTSGETILGIYKLEADTLTICWGSPTKRPTEFSGKTVTGKVDTDWVLVVYEREKK